MNKLYDRDDLNIVMNKLCDIFGEPHEKKQDIRKWVRETFPDEIQPLCDVFRMAQEKLHHKWAGAILAVLPESAWVEDEDGIRLNTKGIGSSMRFLSRQPADSELSESVLLTATRKELITNLLNNMPKAKRKFYSSMLCWCESQCLDFPMSGDSELGLLLGNVGYLYEEVVKEFEHDWRRNNPIPDSECMPPELTCELSKKALQQFIIFIESTYQRFAPECNAPESLMALVSAHISCNRILLEMAAQDARGKEATDMCLSFLLELNNKGLMEVPNEISVCLPTEIDKVLRILLKKWFFYGGEFLKTGSYFSRHMTNTHIENIVFWSGKLQKRYITGRGRMGGELAHGGNNNRFIFALVLVAAFYSNAKTEYELKMSYRKNSTYAVFPNKNNKIELSKHAEDVLLKSYGLVFFSNIDWELNSERLKNYSHATSVKRMCLQLIVNAMIKGRTCSELTVALKLLNGSLKCTSSDLS